MQNPPDVMTTFKRVSLSNTLGLISLGGFWLFLAMMVIIGTTSSKGLDNATTVNVLILLLALILIGCGALGGLLAAFRSGAYADPFTPYLAEHKNCLLTFFLGLVGYGIFTLILATNEGNPGWLIPVSLALWGWYHYKIISLYRRFHQKIKADNAAYAGTPLTDYVEKTLTPLPPEKAQKRVRLVNILYLVSLGGFWLNAILLVIMLSSMESMGIPSQETLTQYALFFVITGLLTLMGLVGGYLAAYGSGSHMGPYEEILAKQKNIFLTFFVSVFLLAALNGALIALKINPSILSALLSLALWTWYHVVVIKRYRETTALEQALFDPNAPQPLTGGFQHQNQPSQPFQAQSTVDQSQPSSAHSQPQTHDGQTRKVSQSDASPAGTRRVVNQKVMFILNKQPFEFTVDSHGIVIGRLGDGTEGWLNALAYDSYISREHFRLWPEGSDFVIECLSSNHMTIDQAPLSQGQKKLLKGHSSHQVTIGRTNLLISFM